MIELPEILDLPLKMLSVIKNINDYNYFLIEGGRGGGKSQSIARILLWLAEQRKVHICCGREIQMTISDSVYKIFVDLIEEYSLNFTVMSTKIYHNITGSDIIFKGFREQGKVNIKGLEGIDVLWIDEAQAITKSTLDVIIPTIRRKNSIVLFSMNRFVRKDAVYSEFITRDDCLHIKINYYDNKHCPEKLIDEARRCKLRSPGDYEHIWEGNPKESSSEFLFSSSKLDKAQKLVFPLSNHREISCLSVDLAGAGGDLCVASVIEARGENAWELTKQVGWSEPDTDITKGKIISMYSEIKPELLILDADGLGYPIYVSIKNIIKNAIKFNGAGQSKRENATNQRADGYMTLKEYIDNGWLKITSTEVISQLEYLKKTYRPDGKIFIEAKRDIKSEHGESPDFADSLMMGIYAINYYSYLIYRESEGTVFLESDFDPYG
ncbi:PBSX family phage terminase large subunit [bacterium]|nr:PBSX family phage terminase large subunit [bacterium]